MVRCQPPGPRMVRLDVAEDRAENLVKQHMTRMRQLRGAAFLRFAVRAVPLVAAIQTPVPSVVAFARGRGLLLSRR